MSNPLDILHEDVKEIKAHVIELVKQGAIHNQVLIEHERRSTNLETRIKPLESDYQFVAKACKAVIILGGLIGVLKTIMELKH